MTLNKEHGSVDRGQERTAKIPNGHNMEGNKIVHSPVLLHNVDKIKINIKYKTTA